VPADIVERERRLNKKLGLPSSLIEDEDVAIGSHVLKSRSCCARISSKLSFPLDNAIEKLKPHLDSETFKFFKAFKFLVNY
jgi:hypothetical protein